MSHAYRFGPFTLDTTRRRLLRDGLPVAVPGKALDVLTILVENCGRTVDKDDLITRVWPNTAVEEANLTQNVFMLRKALGDEPADPQYVATVARRGYRFVGSVSVASDDVTRPPDRHVHRTASLQAYHAYIKGRYFWVKRDREGVQAAIGFFRQAIDLDPTYSLAYVGLAECYITVRVHSWSSASDAFAMARAAATRALEIDETVAEAHATMGVVHMMSGWEWPAAERSFLRALELAPEYPTTHNWYANYLAAQRRFDDAVRIAQEAVTLDPLSVVWRMGVGHMLFLARRYEEAIEAELEALDVDPQFWLSHWVLGMAYDQLGDAARAVAALRKAAELSEGNLMVAGVLGGTLARCGQIDEARRILANLLSRTRRERAPADIVGLLKMALGDIDAALDSFEGAAREGSYLLAFLNVSPLFDSLRSDKRFAALQQLVRLGNAPESGSIAGATC